MKLGLFVAGIAGAWCLINGALYLGFIGLGAHTGLTIPSRLMLGTILLWMPLTEALLLVLVMGGLRALGRTGRSWAKGLAAILIPLTIAATASLLLVAITGWVLRGFGFAFPKASTVRAMVVHLRSVAPWITFKEMFFLGWALGVGVGVVVALMIFRLTPALSASQLRKLLALALLNSLVLGLLMRTAPALLGQRERNQIEAILRVDFLPISTLVWAKVFLPDRTDLHVDEALDPRRANPSLKAHAKHPNILLISVESLRGDEESRITDGLTVMPTLHRLAQEGVHFRRAYAPSNESAYSLSAIITSQHMLKTTARDDFRNPDVPYVRMYDLLPIDYSTGFFSASPEGWQNMREVSWSAKLTRFFDASHAVAGLLPVPDGDTGLRDAVKVGGLPNGNLDDEYPVRAFEEWVDHLSGSGSSRPFFAMLNRDLKSRFAFLPRTFRPTNRGASLSSHTTRTEVARNSVES